MKGNALLAAVGLLLGACGGGSSGAGPVVLVITVDDLRPDHLACYGAPLDVTPNLTSLAREGKVLPDAITPSTAITPALASIHTSLAVPHHGLYSAKAIGAHRLQDPRFTLASQASDRGQRTLAVVSKPQLAARICGLDFGFDDYVDPPPVGERRLDEARVLVQGKLERHADGEGGVFLWWHVSDLDREEIDSGDVLRFLQERLGSQERPSPDLTELLGAGGDADARLERVRASLQRQRGTRSWRLLQEAEYDARLALFDRSLGLLMAFLEEEGLWHRMTVVLTATRGCLLAEAREDDPLRGFDEALIRVPLILKAGEGRRGWPDLEFAYSPKDLPYLLHGLLTDLERPWGAHGPTWGRHEGVSVTSAQYGRSAYVTGESPVHPWRVTLLEDGAARVFDRRSRALLDPGTFSEEESGVLANVQDWLEMARPRPFVLWGAGEQRLEVTLRSPEADIVSLKADRSQLLAHSSTRPTRAQVEFEGATRVLLYTLSPTSSLLVELRSPGRPVSEAEVAIGDWATGQVPRASQVALPRYPHEQAQAWAEEVGAPVVDVRSPERGSWDVAIQLPSPRPVRLHLARCPPSDPPAPLEVEFGSGVRLLSEEGLPDGAVLEGTAPFEVRVRRASGERLAVAAQVGEAQVPAESMRYLGRRFVGEALCFYLPTWYRARSDWFLETSPVRDEASEAPSARIRLHVGSGDGPLGLSAPDLLLLNRLPDTE